VVDIQPKPGGGILHKLTDVLTVARRGERRVVVEQKAPDFLTWQHHVVLVMATNAPAKGVGIEDGNQLFLGQPLGNRDSAALVKVKQ